MHHPISRADLSRPAPRFLLLLFALFLVASLTACPSGTGDTADDGEAAASTDAGTASEADLQARAETLAHELLIVDTHVDVPYRLRDEPEDVTRATEGGDFDYPRAKEGGLDAPFMSIYIPATYQHEGGAKQVADELIDMVEGIAASAPEKFVVATNPDEVYAAYATGKIALPMGMENGAPIEGDLDNLRHFYDRGIRYITLTHSENNHISDSSYEEPDDREWGGLSPFGETLVKEMNAIGMMVDVSHISDDAFWQVMDVTEAPVVATHSSCRHFTPGFERNMSDEMIVALAENGGVIMINFGSAFLTEAAQQHSRARWAARASYADEHDLDRGSEEMRAWNERYLEENPFPYATLDDVVAHIDHVVQLVGIEHVGIGSDFDGVGDSLPEGLKDVSDFPNLVRALLEEGYTEEEIEKILSGNIMRVWREVIAHAEGDGEAALDEAT